MSRTVKEIEENALAEAQSILLEARAKNNAIMSEARYKSEMIVADVAVESAYIFKQKRDAFLEEILRLKNERTKQMQAQLVQETKAMLLQKLESLPAAVYFAILIQAIAAACNTQCNGILLLTAEDKARLPVDFMKRLEKSIPEGAGLRLGSETVEVKNGCILRYEKYEMECSILNVFKDAEQKIDELIKESLFG